MCGIGCLPLPQIAPAASSEKWMSLRPVKYLNITSGLSNSDASNLETILGEILFQLPNTK